MIRNFRVALLFLISAYPLLAVASGGDFAGAVFVHEYNPEDPAGFYSNDLGIVLPTYGARHLAVAYRRMEGLTVTEEEAQRLKPTPSEIEETRRSYASVESWQRSRRALGLADVSIEPDVSLGGYEYRPNCAEDAFRRATQRLDELVADFGTDNVHVRNWVAGQDSVFTNCSEMGVMPEDVTADAPAWLREEREYQSAAARLYRGEYEEAAKGFTKLAVGPDRLAPVAAYLVARSKVRLAEENAVRPAPGEAPAHDPAVTEYHRDAAQAIDALVQVEGPYAYRLAAEQLRGRLEARFHPGDRSKRLNDALLAPRLSVNAWQDVWDYISLAREYAPNAPIMKWIINFESEANPNGFTEASKEWERTRKVAWLVSALRHAADSDQEITALLTQAAQVPRTSPAYLSIGYYRIKALRIRGRLQEARELTRRLLAEAPKDLSARNNLLSEAALLAENQKEFVAVALQTPVSIEYSGSENGVEGSVERWRADPYLNWRSEIVNGTPRYFPYALGESLNSAMPYGVMQGLLDHPWPPHIRRDLLTTLWTRGVLLGKTEELNDIARGLRAFFPKSGDVLSDFEHETEPARRMFLATVFVLRTPAADALLPLGLGRLDRPDNVGALGRRWWSAASLCAAHEGKAWDYVQESCVGDQRTLNAAAAFLVGAPMSKAQDELARMLSQGAVATFAGKIVLDYATKAGDDKYLAEALHLVVRAGRFGENDCQSGRFSQKAFALLTDRFPGSQWQKETPYWYQKQGDCSDRGATQALGRKRTPWWLLALSLLVVSIGAGWYVARRRHARAM